MMRGWRAAAAGLFVLLAAASTFVIAGAALSDQDPGWEPESGVLGTISFYDANGMRVTGGDLSQHPAAFYSVASAPGRANDSLAQLKMFTPRVGVAPLLWTGDTLTGSTPYPNTAAPAAIAHMTAPVATGVVDDFSLADYIYEYPNTSTDAGYQDLYELRLYTSGIGVSQNLAYFRVDIRVTVLGQDQNNEVTGTWNVVYPVAAVTPPSGSATPTPAPTPTDTTTPTTPGTTATVTSTETVIATTTVTTTQAAPTTTPPATTAPATTAAAPPPPTTHAAVPVAATTTEPVEGLSIPPSSPDSAAANTPDQVGGPLTLADYSSSLTSLCGLAVVAVVVALVGFVYYYGRRDSGYPHG